MQKTTSYADDMMDSDEDQDTHDAYLERMKAEGKDRFSGDEDDDSDSSGKMKTRTHTMRILREWKPRVKIDSVAKLNDWYITCS